MTKTDDQLDKLNKRIAAYCDRTKRWCEQNNIEFDREAIETTLACSDLYLQWIFEGAERPVVYRMNRNLGYIRNNLFVGLKSDRKNFAQIHFDQRKEHNAKHGYKPKSKPLDPRTGYVTKDQWDAGIRPHPIKTMPWTWSNGVRKRDAEYAAKRRRELKAARQKRWRHNRARNPRPGDPKT